MPETPPNCCYCDQPLSPVNDVDSEDGGYWSAHWRCTHEDAAGAYSVEARYAGRPDGKKVWRYSTEKRARAQADHLAGSNHAEHGLTFRVRYTAPNYGLGRFVADYPARLRCSCTR